MDYVPEKQDIHLHSIPRKITEEYILVTDSLCNVWNLLVFYERTKY